MRPIQLLMVSSLFVAFGCASIPRPNTYLGVVNSDYGQIKGYNLARDLDDQGHIKPNAKPEIRKLHDLDDLNKYTCTDPEGLANLKAYIQELREAAQSSCQGK